MKIREHRKSVGLLATAAATVLVLAACAEDNGDSGNGDGGNGDQPLSGEQMTIGVFSGWEEGLVAAYLWGHIFSEAGAEVEYVTADPGPTFDGVASGDTDILFDAWLPLTHADHLERHGDNLVDLVQWYDEAPLTIAVNEDSPAQSLDELAENADAYGNRLVGIEAGAGLTQVTQDEVIPTYGLEDMEFLISSTEAMTSELGNAIEAGENIVVTLWEPHWTYDVYPIRNLEDPENALGDPDGIHVMARTGFEEDFPEAAAWVENFHLNLEQLSEAERIMFVDNEAASEEEYLASIEQWLEANPEYVEQLKA